MRLATPGRSQSGASRTRQTMVMHRKKVSGHTAPDKVLTDDSSSRFKELIQELVDEHSRELEKQKAAYEKLLRNSQPTSAVRRPSCVRETFEGINRESCASLGDTKSSPTMRLSIPGLLLDNSEPSTTTGSIPCPEDPRKPSGDGTIAVPFPPSEAPPPLYMGVGQSEENGGHDTTENELLNIMPSAQQRNTSFLSENGIHVPGQRESLKTVGTVGPTGDLNAIGENEVGTPSQQLRAAMNWQTADGRWATLVQAALDLASVDMHFPRQIWKGKINKYATKDHLTNDASKQVRKMMSTVSATQHKSGRVVNRGRAKSLTTSVVHVMDNPWCEFEPLDPHATPRLVWIMIAVLFMVYDLIYVPMQTFNPPYNLLLRVIDTCAQVYWTFDIVSNFVTSVYNKSLLEKRFAHIARIYAKSWLLFDLIVTLPPWFFMIAGQGESTFLKFSGVRAVRLLRFLRLARLAKFDHVVREALEVINSPYTHLVIGTIKLMLSLCIFAHVSGCIWFSIGTGGGGWVERLGFVGETLWYQYLSSMHWALTQFQGTSEVVPGTTGERAYAVAFLLLALIILACFVSSLTNNMGQITQLHSEKNTQQRAVRNYLSENGISIALSVKINRYTEWNRRQKHRQQQAAEVLLVLPAKLLMDLYQEVRSPVLAVHPFFRTFSVSFDRVLRRVCYEALEQKSPCPGDLVYAEGDECFHMYFTLSGQLRYQPHPASIGRVNGQNDSADWEEELDGEDNEVLDVVLENSVFRPVRVKENDWMSEAVLWTEWVHCGDLTGLEDCTILMLDASRFAAIVETFVTARFVASLYARHFVVSINRFGQAFTDLIKHTELFDYDVLECVDKNRFNNESERMPSVHSATAKPGKKSFFPGMPGMPGVSVSGISNIKGYGR